jgi:hypothetical protein
MRRVFSLWIRLLTVTIIALNIVGAPSSSEPLISQTQPPLPALYETQAGIDDWLFAKSPSEVGKFSLQGVRQSKQLSLPSCALKFSPQNPSRTDPLWGAPTHGLFSFQFFFPRKLSPPSSSDDPFLS